MNSTAPQLPDPRAETFGYVCHRCMKCCHHKRIQLNPYEVARLARNRGMTTGEFRAVCTEDGAGLAARADRNRSVRVSRQRRLHRASGSSTGVSVLSAGSPHWPRRGRIVVACRTAPTIARSVYPQRHDRRFPRDAGCSSIYASSRRLLFLVMRCTRIPGTGERRRSIGCFL